ncbi:MAG: hypothetical protein F6J87_31355, partial [Spirulina sp. SIO3F2]|nr:hypothetical protein [Spirulina sp. SIO3F2]
MTGGDTLVYTWDDQNRLVAVAKEGEDPFVTYEYDDDNIRVSQTVAGEGTTEFVVDKNRAYAQVLAEYLNEELVTEYVYGLDLIEESDGGENEEFFGVDGLGSTVVLTD